MITSQSPFLRLLLQHSMTSLLGSSLSQLHDTVFLILFLFLGGLFLNLFLYFLGSFFSSYPLNIGVLQDSVLAPFLISSKHCVSQMILSKPMVSLNTYLYHYLDNLCPNLYPSTSTLYSESPVIHFWAPQRDLKIISYSKQNPNSTLPPSVPSFVVPILSRGILGAFLPICP